MVSILLTFKIINSCNPLQVQDKSDKQETPWLDQETLAAELISPTHLPDHTAILQGPFVNSLVLSDGSGTCLG